MPIAKREDSPIKKIEVSNKLAPDALQTLQEMSESPQIINPVKANSENLNQKKNPAADESDKKYSDTVIARLSKGKRNEFKSFFSQYGITMNSGIEMSIEYVMRQVRAGEATISKGGII